MALTKQVATAFYFTQTTPSTSWSVVHNLGLYPLVEVYVDVSGSLVKIIPQSITYVDGNECTITFTTARFGEAVIS